jgi:uncharacterized protein (DUF983 family)
MPVEYSPAQPDHRPIWSALRRGLAGRCPNCGQGRLFRGYLKVVDACAACAEEMHHQRSDDFGPYLTMTIVGHLVVPAVLGVMLAAIIDPYALLAAALPLTVVLALVLLRPIKGGIVGLQWALRMHGFGGDADKPEDAFRLSDPARRQPLPNTGFGRK